MIIRNKILQKCLLLIILVVGVVGCTKVEDPIISELGENTIAPVDSSDPLDHAIYEIYTKYNTVILYKYDRKTFNYHFIGEKDRWNELSHTLQDDKNVLLKGVNHLKSVFLNFYSDKFKKENLPPKILLAKRIDFDSWPAQFNKDSDFYYSYVAAGKIATGIENLSTTDFNKYKANIHFDFWSGYMLLNKKLIIDPAFFKVSASFYNKDLSKLPGYNAATFNYKSHGFLEGRSRWGKWAPREDQDFKQFLKFIISHKKSEVDAMVASYPLVKQKYTIIIDMIKKQFGFDLQSIGNSN